MTVVVASRGDLTLDAMRRVGARFPKDAEVRGLILFVIGGREGDIGKAVERQAAVGLGILDRPISTGAVQRRVVGSTVLEGVAKTYAGQERVGPHIDARQRRAQ